MPPITGGGDPLRLFVYGTLMRGQGSHHLLATSLFRGPARTLRAFTLLELGEYPALVRGGAVGVAGELYEVDSHALRRIDVFEGHPTLFRRGPVWLEDGSAAQAYLLAVGRPPAARVIATGDWRRRAGADPGDHSSPPA